MKTVICENYEQISKAATDMIIDQVNFKPNSVLGLATGSTPLGMYKQLVEEYRNGKVDFRNVKTFNLDEYYPIASDNSQSYHYYMKENFFSKINIDIENTNILNGDCDNPKKECEDFEKLIENSGGIDIQVLGIGQNGHIGFNEPDNKLILTTHLTSLTESTIKANSRFFKKVSDVPTKALTMGIGTILKAEKIILLAFGQSKHKTVLNLMTDDITTDIPASMLKTHKDVTLICDKSAFYGDI